MVFRNATVAMDADLYILKCSGSWFNQFLCKFRSSWVNILIFNLPFYAITKVNVSKIMQDFLQALMSKKMFENMIHRVRDANVTRLAVNFEKLDIVNTTVVSGSNVGLKQIVIDRAIEFAKAPLNRDGPFHRSIEKMLGDAGLGNVNWRIENIYRKGFDASCALSL